MQLKAGQLRMNYDRGFLRYIKLGNYEVLRMIYFALRDHNWDTMDGYLEDEKIQTEERSFLISYRWTSANSNFPFVWRVTIEGRDTSEIIFSIEGSAQLDVQKNRTGFCILHSIKENAGGPCVIRQPDGQIREGLFPRYISPHQPFFDIAEMQWPLAKLGRATLHFTGDVFEMEDQRNWTDDSYKTYCTPLRIPFPAWLKKDEEVRQSVHLIVQQNAGIETPFPASEICVLEPRSILSSRPKIGVGSPSQGYYLKVNELETLRKLGFDHYRIELDFSNTHWQVELDGRIKEALALQIAVELCLFFTDQYEAEVILLANYLDQLPVEMHMHILILHHDHKTTPPELAQTVVPALSRVKENISLGAGTAAYFTELNRERVVTEGLQFVSYSVNPQVHAFDNASMTENTEAQKYTVESARQYFPDQLVHVSPVTLCPRFNPNATAAETSDTGGLPDSVDVRQMNLFGAGWTLGSLMHLAESGADRITYFEAVGWRGITQGSEAPALTELFPAKKNMLFPLFHILRCFLQHKQAEWLPFSSTYPLALKAMGFREKDSVKLLLNNCKDIAIEGHIKYPCSRYKLFIFDSNNLADSYFDADFLSRSLEQSPLVSGPVPSLMIAANAIIYAELFD